MIARLAHQLIQESARQFPVVLILGPRQCGITTLLKNLFKENYFDLEKPSDYQVFASDPELAFNQLPEPLILDEAQTLPEIFSVLRSIIDEQRHLKGRFYLLGSVNPNLVRQVSESLAGRIGTVELTPFLYPEIITKDLSLEELWLSGGYPDALLESGPDPRTRWLEQYIQALVQRDLTGHDLKIHPPEMRRFLGMLSHIHGGLLNASELGRSLSVTYHTIKNYLHILEGHFLVRQLQPWHSNLGKRLVKSPKIYLRDSGLLHYLLGIRTTRDLLQSPRRGASWEGFLIEQIIALERLTHIGSQFWFYRTQAGAEIDLLIDRGEHRIGLEFKCGSSVSKADASGLKAGLQDGIISRGIILYSGSRRFPISEQIEAIPAHDLLKEYLL